MSSHQKQENKTVSKALLESYGSALYQVKDFFDSVSKKKFTELDGDLAESILKLGEKLGKNIETLAVLEQKVEEEENEEIRRRGGVKGSKFED